MEKKWLDRGACPKCGSSDGNVKHSEGYSYCFSCNTRFGENMQHEKVVPIPTESAIKTVGTTGALSERNISKKKVLINLLCKYKKQFLHQFEILHHQRTHCNY